MARLPGPPLLFLDGYWLSQERSDAVETVEAAPKGMRSSRADHYPPFLAAVSQCLSVTGPWGASISRRGMASGGNMGVLEHSGSCLHRLCVMVATVVPTWPHGLVER